MCGSLGWGKGGGGRGSPSEEALTVCVCVLRWVGEGGEFTSEGQELWLVGAEAENLPVRCTRYRCIPLQV